MKSLRTLTMTIAAAMAVALPAVAGEPAADDEAVQISLDEIWAWDMSGTRDVRELTATGSDVKNSEAPPADWQRMTTSHFIRYLLDRASPYADALPGFVVSGEPRRAVNWAKISLYKRERVLGDSLPAGNDFYVFFFSKTCAYRVQLEHVERRGTVIEIRYSFVPRYTPEATPNFALIPLGELPGGTYRVEITQAPLSQEFIDAGFQPVGPEAAPRIVCQPFSFTVENPSVPEPSTAKDPESQPNAETVTIPLDRIWSNGANGGRSLRDLEPEIFIRRDTPEKIKKYSTPEAIEEIRRKAKHSLVRPIESAMRELPLASETNKPKPGFAVKGVDRAALRGVYEVLVENEKPTTSFKTGTEISLIFFSHPTQPHVRIHRIERKGQTFRIHYILISHGHLTITWNLAVIPVGALPAGEYHVRMIRVQKDEENKFNQQDFSTVSEHAEQSIVCRPFSFIISDKT